MIGFGKGLRIIVELALVADVVHHLQALMIGQGSNSNSSSSNIELSLDTTFALAF